MNAPPWREAASLILACRTPITDVVGNDLADAMIATKWANASQTTSGISRFDYKVCCILIAVTYAAVAVCLRCFHRGAFSYRHRLIVS